MNRLSERVIRNGKIVENKLNHLENWIENEAGKLKDQVREVSKKNCDEVKNELVFNRQIKMDAFLNFLIVVSSTPESKR